MKGQFRSLALLGAMLSGAGLVASADTLVTVDPSAPWQGFMNVFETPANGGGYVFGSGWGTADLTAVFTGPVLQLGPNSINDPNPFWYTPAGFPGCTGNKIMDANMYVEPVGSLPGQTVTFAGTVLSNTLLPDKHTSVAFIKDFAPDYSSFVMVSVPMNPGPFSVSLATDGDPARHVQYGFETIGPDVWITDVGPFGNVQITAPEPTSLGLLAAGALLALRRRRAC